MAAPTESYVDPSINANTGAGSIGDPAGDLQGWLNRMTRDATNGDRINVKAGTAEVLAATLVLTTYGAPTEVAPLIIQGYTSAAGDGGIGEIDGAGSYGCFAGTEDFVTVRHMHIHNGGAANLINLDTASTIADCQVHNTTGVCITATTYSVVSGCEVYDGANIGINLGAYVAVRNNFLYNSTKNFTTAIATLGIGHIYHNIISVGGATNGIQANLDGVRAVHNTILSSSGTGYGVGFFTAARFNREVANNYIEGFSGAGGDGIDFATVSEGGTIYRNNAFCNNTANETNKGTRMLIDENNQALGATALAKSGANTFANRFIYFAPLAAIQGGAHPSGANFDIGAVQHADPAGGGGGARIIGG